MLTGAEEQSYLYLRLNGFFPLGNFNKSKSVKFSADADLLAVRTPFVFEEVGGQNRDWDETLFKYFKRDWLVGLICQVKGGKFENENFFDDPYLTDNLQRLGLTGKVDDILKDFKASAVINFKNELGQDCQIGKLLIS